MSQINIHLKTQRNNGPPLSPRQLPTVSMFSLLLPNHHNHQQRRDIRPPATTTTTPPIQRRQHHKHHVFPGPSSQASHQTRQPSKPNHLRRPAFAHRHFAFSLRRAPLRSAAFRFFGGRGEAEEGLGYASCCLSACAEGCGRCAVRAVVWD